MTSTPALTLTIIQSILPILVTLAFGYFAAFRRDFDSQQAGVLIRLVMLYALPLELLVSILSTPRAQVFSAGPLASLILLAMVGGFAIIFLIVRLVFTRRTSEAAQLAMSITAPSVPVLGLPLLGHISGPPSLLPFSTTFLAHNYHLLPPSLILRA